MSVEPLATPFRGFKLARIVELRGRLRLAPLHKREGSPGFYDPTGFAICEELHDHRPPQWSCTCGFHAVSSREELWRLGWVELATPVLEVELSGRVIEHRHGLRGEYQEVISLELSDRCHRCGGDAVCLGSFSRRSGLGPSCDRCARRSRFSLDRLEQDLGLPVRLLPVSERAPLTLERLVFAVQVIPVLLFSLSSILASIFTGQAALAGLGGLAAGGWLAPGRAAASLLLHRREVPLQEYHRVLGLRAGVVLGLTLGCWAVAGIVGAALSSPL